MIVKITNVVKKIVILLHQDGMLAVHIYGRFIKLTLICLAVKYVTNDLYKLFVLFIKMS